MPNTCDWHYNAIKRVVDDGYLFNNPSQAVSQTQIMDIGTRTHGMHVYVPIVFRISSTSL